MFLKCLQLAADIENQSEAVPSHAQVLCMLSATYLKSGDAPTALEKAEKCVELLSNPGQLSSSSGGGRPDSPDWMCAHETMGWCLHALARDREAIQHFNRSLGMALAIDLELSKVLIGLKARVEVRGLQNSSHLNGQQGTVLRSAIFDSNLQAQDDPGEHPCRMIVRLDQRNQEKSFKMANIRFINEGGSHGRSVEQLQGARDWGSLLAHHGLGQAFLAQGNLDDAIHHLRQGLQIMEQSGELERQAMTCVYLGVAHAARAQSAGAAQTDDHLQDAEGWLKKAHILSEGVKEGTESHQIKVLSALQLARVLHAQGYERRDEAADALRQSMGLAVAVAKSMCDECGQVRGKDAPMLASTCANCGVARYCNHSHQKIAWKRPWAEGPPHKLICPLLKKFKLEGKRKHVVSNEELLEFLDELRTKCSLAHGGNGGGGVYGEVHELGA